MKPKYFIEKELIGGRYYYMIYRRYLFFWSYFYERWNTIKTAKIRLNELLNK